MIVVFLNNKLISADTIIPLMMSVKESQPNRTIEFYDFDMQTAEALRRNIVLWDALSSIGTLESFGGVKGSKFQRLFNKFKNLYLVVRLAVIACTRRTHFVHFKALNSGPLRLLSAINPKRTILAESNCWGYHKTMIESVGNIKRQRKTSTKAGRASALLGFSIDWPEFYQPDHTTTKKIIAPSTHYGPAWQTFIRNGAKRYTCSVLTTNGWPEDTPYIVFILGFFGKFAFFKNEMTALRLFRETVAMLDKEVVDFPIILKPHIITDRQLLSDALAPYSDKRFIVADLHPMTLASQAFAFIGNYYSTTFADAIVMGVPTIEYTDYTDETLAVTQGQSMRQEEVTYFLNNDETGLRQILRDVQRKSRSSCKIIDEQMFFPALELFK
jgi:hypothetical protein